MRRRQRAAGSKKSYTEHESRISWLRYLSVSIRQASQNRAGQFLSVSSSCIYDILASQKPVPVRNCISDIYSMFSYSSLHIKMIHSPTVSGSYPGVPDCANPCYPNLCKNPRERILRMLKTTCGKQTLWSTTNKYVGVRRRLP